MKKKYRERNRNGLFILSLICVFLLFACGEKDERKEIKKSESSEDVEEKKQKTAEKEMSTRIPVSSTVTDKPASDRPHADRPIKAPEEIIIENKGYEKKRKGPVKFSHLDHADNYDVACTECHHDYQDGKNVWKEGDPVKKCIECHSPLKREDKIKKLQLAFHDNCKNCHKDMAKDGITEDAPYKKCANCHQNK